MQPSRHLNPEMAGCTNTEEVLAMSEFGNGAPGTYKTIGVQIPNDLHSQASMIAKLDDISLRDACIRGLRIYVEQKQAEPDFNLSWAKCFSALQSGLASR